MAEPEAEVIATTVLLLLITPASKSIQAPSQQARVRFPIKKCGLTTLWSEREHEKHTHKLEHGISVISAYKIGGMIIGDLDLN